MKIDWLNLLERAAWTFAEGFLVALPATFSVGSDGAANTGIRVPLCFLLT